MLQLIGAQQIRQSFRFFFILLWFSIQLCILIDIRLRKIILELTHIIDDFFFIVEIIICLKLISLCFSYSSYQNFTPLFKLHQLQSIPPYLISTLLYLLLFQLMQTLLLPFMPFRWNFHYQLLQLLLRGDNLFKKTITLSEQLLVYSIDLAGVLWKLLHIGDSQIMKNLFDSALSFDLEQVTLKFYCLFSLIGFFFAG